MAVAADKNEGFLGARTAFSFKVTRDQALNKPTHINWEVVGASPSLADQMDFPMGMPTGIVTINSGATEKTFSVDIKGDQQQEFDDYFHMTLLASPGVELDQATAPGIIRDDDTTTT